MPRSFVLVLFDQCIWLVGFQNIATLFPVILLVHGYMHVLSPKSCAEIIRPYMYVLAFSTLLLSHQLVFLLLKIWLHSHFWIILFCSYGFVSVSWCSALVYLFFVIAVQSAIYFWRTGSNLVYEALQNSCFSDRTFLKVPLKSNSQYPFFTFSYTVSLFETFCQISSYYEHQNSRFLDLYFREFTAAINFPCSKSWLRIGVNDVILSKILHGLKL